MGAALATPAVTAGNRVRLWGTWLDGGILAELGAGRPHPRTGVAVDRRVELLDAGRLAEALDRAAAGLRPGAALLLCTKGLGRRPDGTVGLLPPLLAAALPGPLAASCPVVAVGGPC